MKFVVFLIIVATAALVVYALLSGLAQDVTDPFTPPTDAKPRP